MKCCISFIHFALDTDRSHQFSHVISSPLDIFFSSWARPKDTSQTIPINERYFLHCQSLFHRTYYRHVKRMTFILAHPRQNNKLKSSFPIIGKVVHCFLCFIFFIFFFFTSMLIITLLLFEWKTIKRYKEIIWLITLVDFVFLFFSPFSKTLF